MVITFLSCGPDPTKENKLDTIIQVEGDALDLRISSGAPKKIFNREQLAKIGFSGAAESRMLLYFPYIEKLYQDDVQLSSVTAVELYLSVAEVPVNPENIELRPLTETWTPYATWSSRAILAPGYGWASAGGSYDLSVNPIIPDIRRHEYSDKLLNLRFDITNLVLNMVVNGQTNHGFLISVKASELNAVDEIAFMTSNADDDKGHPKSALIFTKRE